MVTAERFPLSDDVTNYRPPTAPAQGGNIEERLRALESLVSYNKQILTTEVLQFGCPARTSRLGLEVCSIKNNQIRGPSSSTSTSASPSSSYGPPPPSSSYGPPPSTSNCSPFQSPPGHPGQPPGLWQPGQCKESAFSSSFLGCSTLYRGLIQFW